MSSYVPIGTSKNISDQQWVDNDIALHIQRLLRIIIVHRMYK